MDPMGIAFKRALSRTGRWAWNNKGKILIAGAATFYALDGFDNVMKMANSGPTIEETKTLAIQAGASSLVGLAVAGAWRTTKKVWGALRPEIRKGLAAGALTTLVSFSSLSGPKIYKTLSTDSGHYGHLRNWYNSRWGVYVCEAEDQCRYLWNDTTRKLDRIDRVLFAYYNWPEMGIHSTCSLALGGLVGTGVTRLTKRKKQDK